MKTTLTVKEQTFLDLLVTTAKGNATEAAQAAGYGSTRASARRLGTRLLSKVHIQQALIARQRTEVRAAVLSAEARDTLLSTIAQTGEHEHNRIAAIKELNKCSGRHSIKHVLDVTEKLSDIIAGSRTP